ncbi:MAG: hypothetical protein JWM95_537 [Gemmatimonadetes bacterium]|nr:hypothetical protein [Gemmatimonadota bacterium]
MNRRIARAIAIMVQRTVRPWVGPVERRDPDVVRERSVHLTWRCRGAHCGRWTMDGAYLIGRCNFCNTPRSEGTKP